MILGYGSLAYLLVLLITFGLCAFFWWIIRKKIARAKLGFLFALAILNVLQHFLKQYLYPHLWGAGFGLNNTAYNVCATVILLTPFALAARKGFFRVFISYLGAIGSLGAIVFPVWFIGKSVFDWEYFRYFLCHLLLFLTSALPILWGMRRPHWHDFLKAAPAFFLVLITVLVNDLVVLVADGGFAPERLYDELCSLNPFGLMAPQSITPWLDRVYAALTPACFLPSAAHPYYTPVLWCAVPLYLFVTLAAFVLFCIADRFYHRLHFRAQLTP